MFPEERKEGSPRFAKLHFPVGLWVNSPRKRLAQIRHRWPSAASVRSNSSDGAEPRPHGKAKAPRHKRLSNLFHRANAAPTQGGAAPQGAAAPQEAGQHWTPNRRWVSEKKLCDLSSPPHEDEDEDEEEEEEAGGGGGGNEEREGRRGPGRSPRPRQPPPPVVLKIFGADVSSGANYKSVLATRGCTARQLLRDALGRYGLRDGRADDDDDDGDDGEFVLCDAVGRPGGAGGAWRPRFVRVLGAEERPVLLHEGWRARDGCARRFLIRRRADVRRGGGRPPSPPLRSRAASGAPPPPQPRPPSVSLRRSVSDANLSARRRRERRAVLSAAPDEAGSAAEPRGDGGERSPERSPAERREDERSPEEDEDDEDGSGSVRPPRRRPYCLVLHGHGPQDPVLLVLSHPAHIFGRRDPERSPPADPRPLHTALPAADLLPRHCCIRTDRSPASVRPFRGAAVTHNGAPLLRPAPLRPGDLLCLGRQVALLFKDPRLAGPEPRPAWLPRGPPPPGITGALSCAGCGRSPRERHEAVRAVLESSAAELRYREQDEEALLGAALAAADGGGAGLGPAFLLGLCLQHAATARPQRHLAALLGSVAGRVKDAVWEKIKEIGEQQPDNPQEAPGIQAVSEQLRPLLLWLANGLELLNIAQGRVAELEAELEMDAPDPELPAALQRCDEALAVLDEVIMSTFQQSVYYLTKTLYSTLPSLLDSNPFAGASEPSVAPDLGAVPEGIRPTLAVFQSALELSRSCQLHPDLTSQTFGYLFFFCNASLFNTLMERGSAGPFFQWSRAVRIRTNLDLLLDWLQAVGLGDIAAEFFRKLSATANLLCTPRSSLSKATWARLRAEYPALSPAQLHHVLRHYQLGPGQSFPEGWSPPPEERDAVAAGDIFESFSDHPPLLLPTDGFQLRLGEAVTDSGLRAALFRVRRMLWEREEGALPANLSAMGRDGGV